ncbi:hypothetical protein HIM_09976 [Hirsutella minnesotensis 3608]|uniref:Zn(2)-C6 fungal-type domain-containing protein n=1 Tax=Hirsutella minnesotensis 3608 TaxID=1043627 RepID=A0A0F7ZGB9_9HYPO|nr:hypothetical protein HIM_09976 [Hirsutella minnesotensis 3608]
MADQQSKEFVAIAPAPERKSSGDVTLLLAPSLLTPKRSVTRVACDSCRRKRAKCDGLRPRCGKCTRKNEECVFAVREGETSLQAQERKCRDLENELRRYQELIKVLRTRPEDEAYSFLRRLRATDELAAIIPITNDAGASPIDSTSPTFTDSPATETTQQYREGRLILVPSKPWTAVGNDGLVSELITEYFNFDNCSLMPLGDQDVFVEEMRNGDKSTAQWCSPLLVNAICAQRAMDPVLPIVWHPDTDPKNPHNANQPAKEVSCASCRAHRKERVTKSRAAVAAMRNIASRLPPRQATKRTDSLANLTPPRRIAPTPASVNGLQSLATPALFCGLAPALQGLPRPLLRPSIPSAAEGPSPVPSTLSLPRVVLGTPIPQTPIPQNTLPATSLLSQDHRRGRYTRQGTFNPRPQPQERQFDRIVDPPFTADLNLPALSEEDQELVREFYTALNDDKMHSCIRCRERWFDMKRNSLKICSRCVGRDRKKVPNEPYFFSAANHLDFGEVPTNLPDLTMVEEMLIARVHVHVKVLQVRGAQYKYRGHVVHFLRNVGRLFEELPALPEELDIVLLRPPNTEGDPRFRQQFARDFRVRRSCLSAWLHYLQRHHPGYRDTVVSQNRLQRIPLDGSVVASIASQVADIPDGEVPQGPVEEVVEEDPSDADASAIPNLQVTDTELNALQSRFLDGTPNPERMADLEYMPRSAQAHHQMPLPSIRRTPIDEFNRSQPLLTLAFPTLYPNGKADFVEPRLRNITYQDYLGHAMRWHDGRFARHKTWPFVALNTMLRAQVRKRSDYFVKQRDSRRQPLTRADLEEAMAEPDEPEAQALQAEGGL